MSLIDEARAVRDRITDRLRELEPLVREYEQLKQVAAEMGLSDEDAAGAAPAPSAPRASTASRTPRPAGSTGRRQRDRGARAPAEPAASASGGQIGDRMLEAVRSQPGKTVAEYAEMLGVPATALYRPVRELTKDGALLKRARQLFPA